MASAIHKRRTGRGLKISEHVVLKEEIYEEEKGGGGGRRVRELAPDATQFTLLTCSEPYRDSKKLTACLRNNIRIFH